MGRGQKKEKPKPRHKPKKLQKKVKDPEEKFRRKPWLRPEPACFVNRFTWDAVKPNWTYDEEKLEVPVTHVVLNYHSRFPPCTRETQCRYIVQTMQEYQCKLLRYQDLAYNWYIAGDGHAYEGRGWTKHPKQQHELSTECLEIALMGDYPFDYDPPQKMIDLFYEVVNYGIKKEYIKKDYQLHEFRLPSRPIPRST